jgi:organic radical activating enzyme
MSRILQEAGAMKHGKIGSEKLSILVAHHCNLSCERCSVLSPRQKKFFASPDVVATDLALLGKHYHPRCVSLTGGEPLLHPDLIEVIDAARRSGVGKYIEVLTNGLILHRMPHAFWERVDKVRISLYPGHRASTGNLKRYRQKAKEHGVYLEFKHVNSFRNKVTDLGTTNNDLIKRIFITCETAHLWRCHTLCDGFFYRCPQAAMIPRVFQPETQSASTRDGIRIRAHDGFLPDLERYLASAEPLDACFHCLGTAGRRFSHVQELARKDGFAQGTEELLDYARLERLEKAFLRPNRMERIEKVNRVIRRSLAALPAAVQVSRPLQRTIFLVRKWMKR